MVYVFVDGKVVVIEEMQEIEYFNDWCIQISIFMLFLNVYVNCMFFSGEVKYYKYYLGKYLVVWYLKLSMENECFMVVFDNGKQEILLCQIVGVVVC